MYNSDTHTLSYHIHETSKHLEKDTIVIVIIAQL